MPPQSSTRRPALRLVAFADSTCLPREEEGVWLLFEETWAGQLQTNLRAAGLDVEVLNRGARARHSYDLGDNEYVEHVKYTAPDIVMLEVGLNDSAPRLFTVREKAFINRGWFPAWMRKRIIRYHSKNRARIIGKNPYRKVHTKPEEYRSNLLAFMRKLKQDQPGCRLVLVPIVCDPVLTDAKSPGFSENTHRYNDIQRELAKEMDCVYVELSRCLPDEKRIGGGVFYPDGIHVNTEASTLMATELTRVVLEMEGMPTDPSVPSPAAKTAETR